MIIGNSVINYDALRSYSGRAEELPSYAESLVPIWARHIPGIVDNQRYYLAVHLRKVKSLPYKMRKDMLNSLVDKIRIRGSALGFVTIGDVINLCNKHELLKALIDEERNREDML